MSTTTPRSFETRAFAAADPRSPLAPMTIHRREPGPSDVRIEILYCGSLPLRPAPGARRVERHADVYPCVPGHEIVGRVTGVGSRVTSFKAGRPRGVGCLVDSCRTCPSCRDGPRAVLREARRRHLQRPDIALGRHVTYGGYSNSVVVDEHFVLRVPRSLDLGRRPRRCSAPASRPTRRCGTGTSARARRSASWAWAGSATWA